MKSTRTATVIGALLFSVTSILSTGCQIDVAGQTLPSAYYMSDDLQYFSPGSEFKLANEAAAMKTYEAEQELGE